MDMELFGGCNYKCQMCPQGEPGREKEFKKSHLKIPLGTPVSSFVHGKEAAEYQIKTGEGVLGAYFEGRLE
mgnify:CR=1 FL=1